MSGPSVWGSEYLIFWVIILLQVRVGKSSLHSYAVIGIEGQHPTQQVQSYGNESHVRITCGRVPLASALGKRRCHGTLGLNGRACK